MSGSIEVVTDHPPLLRVVRGDATAEELAALVAVLTARTQGAGESAPPAARSPWGRPALRQALAPGPGAWRQSALPR